MAAALRNAARRQNNAAAADDDDDGDEDENDVTTQYGVGGDGADAVTDVSKMSEKQRRKWDKSLTRWRVFVDFLARHVSVMTYKYNVFERDDLTPFMMSLEHAELLRSQSRLKKGETARINSILTMKACIALLLKNDFVSEANCVRDYVDLVGRMRGLATIAGGLYKALRKGKVSGVDGMRQSLEFWKGFCVRSFDYTQLTLDNVVDSSLNSLERRYLAWPTALRTSLYLAGQFLRRCCNSTGLDLLNSDDPAVSVQHMQAAEVIVAVKMQEMLFERVLQESNAFNILNPAGTGRSPALTASSALLGGSSSMTAAGRKSWEMPPLADIEPALLKPVRETSILLRLPAEPPKEKKRRKGKKGRKKGGKKAGAGASKSAGRHKSGKRKKK